MLRRTLSLSLSLMLPLVLAASLMAQEPTLKSSKSRSPAAPEAELPDPQGLAAFQDLQRGQVAGQIALEKGAQHALGLAFQLLRVDAPIPPDPPFTQATA